jgi:transposase-like protein
MTCRKCNHTAKKFGTYGKRRIQRYRCISCRSTFSDHALRIDAFN